MFCCHFGNWSLPIPCCILVKWQVCWRWHVFLTQPCQWLSENPKPCCFILFFYWLPKRYLSIILFLTNSSQPSFNLIALWGCCKTKALLILVRLNLPSSPKHDSHILGVLMSHTHTAFLALKVHSTWGFGWTLKCGGLKWWDFSMLCRLCCSLSPTQALRSDMGAATTQPFYSWWLQITEEDKLVQKCLLLWHT